MAHTLLGLWLGNLYPLFVARLGHLWHHARGQCGLALPIYGAASHNIQQHRTYRQQLQRHHAASHARNVVHHDLYDVAQWFVHACAQHAQLGTNAYMDCASAPLYRCCSFGVYSWHIAKRTNYPTRHPRLYGHHYERMGSVEL